MRFLAVIIYALAAAGCVTSRAQLCQDAKSAAAIALSVAEEKQAIQPSDALALRIAHYKAVLAAPCPQADVK